MANSGVPEDGGGASRLDNERVEATTANIALDDVADLNGGESHGLGGDGSGPKGGGRWQLYAKELASKIGADLDEVLAARGTVLK